MAEIGDTSTGYSVFEYMYRDAGNWKTYGSILFTGDTSKEGLISLVSCFEDEDLFVAEQVEIPPLCCEHFATYGGPTELDHAYHEFVALRPATEKEAETMMAVGSIDNLLTRIRKAARCWNVLLSPNSRL